MGYHLGMNYWLVKTEPSAYSIDDLAKRGTDHWDGVRNFAARNHLKDMQAGDQVLVYHSSTKPAGVVGIAEVAKTAYPDPSAWDPSSHYYDPKATPTKPIWVMVDLKFREKFLRIVTLDEIKSTEELRDMVLLKRSRLSVQPVQPAEFELVLKLAK